MANEHAASKRQALSKKTRFEVFKRDSFTCQYCGRKWNEAQGWRLILDAAKSGATTDQIGYVIDDESAWTYWRRHMEDLITSLDGGAT